MFRLIGKILFFFIRFIIHLPFAVFHELRRFFFGVNFDKMNGYEFEEYAAGYLKRNGYSKVTVTKASRDFGVDLIAKNTGLPMQSSANYIRERWVTVPYRKLLPVNPITIVMKQWSLPTAFSIPEPLPLPEPMMSFSSTAPS